MVLGVSLTLQSALSAGRLGCHHMSLCVEAKERQSVYVFVPKLCLQRAI